MTAPGDFSSGDVLTAADMNDLPAGLLDYFETASDFSLSTSVTNVGSISFTLPSTRKVFLSIGGWVTGLSGGNEGRLFLNDANDNSGTGRLFTFVKDIQGGLMMTRVVTLAAGTYTMYFNADCNTGTGTLNGQGGSPSSLRFHHAMAVDLGN